MKIDDLMKKTVEEVLDEYCIAFSPECDYNYGIARWDDVNRIHEEFDIEEQYFFSGDSLIPIDYCFDYGEDILELQDLKRIMGILGIAKKEFCPKCDSEDYHFDYNKECMLCNECGYEGEPHYEEIEIEECD